MANNTLLWDKNVTSGEVRKILKDEAGERFVEYAALLLSRANDPKQVFTGYLDKVVFCRNWRKIKNKMRQNRWNDNRIIFWDAVYGVAVQGIDKSKLKAKKTISVNPDMKPIGDKIRKARRHTGWTQSELSGNARVSQQTISLVENGCTNISLNVLKRILDALDLEIHIRGKEGA